MTPPLILIDCPACGSQYDPRDGYVCTLVSHDHFRCPACGQMTSRAIKTEVGDPADEG